MIELEYQSWFSKISVLITTYMPRNYGNIAGFLLKLELLWNTCWF